jgi:hypothetical protein
VIGFARGKSAGDGKKRPRWATRRDPLATHADAAARDALIAEIEPRT